MNGTFRWLLVGLLAIVSTVARAEFHTFQIEQIYSDGTGTVQFAVLHEVLGFNGEGMWAGNALVVTAGATTRSLVFPLNLPGDSCGDYICTGSPTAHRRVLVATRGFGALGRISPDYVVPNGFFPINGGTVDYAGVDQITYAALPTDGVSALDRNGHSIPNLATNFAGETLSVVGTPVVAQTINVDGLWWNAPAGSESGWGINFEHEGDIIFATWFTYDSTGKAWWLTMTANKTATGTYTGTLYQTRGPAFNAVPFSPAAVVATPVGSGTLSFSDDSNGSFAYTVNGTSQTKAITRQVFGPQPVCSFGTQSNLALATNYQGLWWNAPGGSESGWGINFSHQGDTIFATWFTYALDGTPLWLSGTVAKTAGSTYTGALYQTRGPAFSAVPFSPTAVTATPVGTATLTFADGNTATFAYSVNGVSQTKTLTRQVLTPPGTACQ